MMTNLIRRHAVAVRAVAGLGVLLAASMASAQTANQPTKNGYPCIAGVCLGDSLEDLKKHPIKADGFPAKVGKLHPGAAASLSMAEGEIARMRILGIDKAKLSYAEKMRLAGFGHVSRQGLDLFQRITHACEKPLEVNASWTLPDGQNVLVQARLLRIPEDAERHTWVVTEIQRRLPQMTAREKAEVFASLEKRWEEILAPSTWPRYVPWYEREFGKGIHLDQLDRQGKAELAFQVLAGLSYSTITLRVVDPNRELYARNDLTPACAALKPKID